MPLKQSISKIHTLSGVISAVQCFGVVDDLI